MGDRYWLWMIARLVVAVVLVGWVGSYMMPQGGEKEFQQAIEAMKQVRSLRMNYTAQAEPARQFNIQWEVVCSQNAYHYQEHNVSTDPNYHPFPERNELHAGTVQYVQKDGAWQPVKAYVGMPASDLCHQFATGQEGRIMPPFNLMIQRGVIQKGDKKTVNGVRCRVWNVAMRSGPNGIEHSTVCLGLDDHLPYERTVDWQNSRTTYSDYNSPFQLDLPEAGIQQVSATSGVN